ncbi:hypothetical protein V8E54_011320 [Elaphomyces granulatus]
MSSTSPSTSSHVSPVPSASPSLVIRKRRATDTTDEFQAERVFYEGMLTAVDSDGKRVISDSTEKLVQDILHQYRAIQAQDNVATRKASFALNRRLFEKRLEEDKKYREAFLKYKSLERDSWYLRYGDYLAISLADLQGKAKAAHKPTEEEERDESEAYRMFVSRPWSEIQRLIDAELQTLKTSVLEEGPEAPLKLPMISFVKKVASMANEWDFNRVQRTIAIYVDRNNVAHSHIDELAQEDHFKLAAKMVEDLKALADTPACCRDKIDTAKQAILTTARKYFEEFAWDDEASRLLAWRARPQKQQAPTPAEAAEPDAPRSARRTRRQKSGR